MQGEPGAPSDGVFRNWVATGTKFASLAGAGTFSPLFYPASIFILSTGSIYLLMLIAGYEKRQAFSKLPVTTISEICNVLRWPNGEKLTCFEVNGISSTILEETAIGRQVCKYIIPSVDSLRRAMPLSFSTMFAPPLLQECKLSPTIACHDIESSDAFFDSMKNKYVFLMIYLASIFLLAPQFYLVPWSLPLVLGIML